MYLIYVVFTPPSPPATTAIFGSYLSSLYSIFLTLYRRCWLAYLIVGGLRGFVGPKKKTSVDLLVFNPL